MHRRQAERLRPFQVAVIRLDRRRDDEPVHSGMDAGAVLRKDADALRLEAGLPVAQLPEVEEPVRSADALALRADQLRQRAHPDPGDADEMIL